MLDINSYLSLESSWERLKAEDRPIFIYGMGDGCIKLMRQFERFGIKISGIFASDEFVRGHSFEGFKVKRLSEVEEENDDFVIALAFAAGYKELIDKIDAISRKHTLIMPDTAVYGGEPFLKETLVKNYDKANAVYEKLYDNKSKEVFDCVLKYKITGDISFLKKCETTPSEAYENILKVRSYETYVDLGAYNGDTVLEYLSFAKGYKQIFAVEPNVRNFKKLTSTLSGYKNTALINAAAWDKDDTVPFSKGSGRQSRASEVGILTKAVSVDSLLSGMAADYIKYDVEGEEKRAIEGSKNTIKTYSPKLCVAVYHKLLDMFELPTKVLEINSDYKLYLRHFPYYPAWETNMFFVK